MSWTTIRVDRLRLIERMRASFDVVRYKMGAKPDLRALPGQGFREADCSGFVRWLIYQASYGKTKMPLGSWHQRRWCERMGFKLTDYAHTALSDNRLRIGFTNPKAKRAGHVWLIFNRASIECYGGRGAGRRAWDTSVLADRADFCFVLTEPIQ